MAFSRDISGFRFGLETEYIVVDKCTDRALWYEDLKFAELNALLESVDLGGIPSLEGLDLEPPHTRLLPFVVEGYHLPDQDFKAIDILPKGLEIRTPVCRSIEQCLQVQADLFLRLCGKLAEQDKGLVALSHHPVAHRFRGPQNKRRHDFWLWAMEVMTTYGPDINLGVPEDVWQDLDLEDFSAKVNYYSPALAALSARAPFRDEKLWSIQGKVGKSLRMYRRSVIAPPIEVHPQEGRRIEFKSFDMTPSLQDLQGYFLLVFTLLVSELLPGRASDATRIYESGEVARTGLQHPSIQNKLHAIFSAAQKTLPYWGLSPLGIEGLHERFLSGQTPADALIDRYHEVGGDMGQVLREEAQSALRCARDYLQKGALGG